MLTDEEKTKIAKERYQRFLVKINAIEEPIDPKYISYIIHNDGSTTEDFYWYNNPITPTAVFRWIRSYNQARIARTKWTKKIVLEDEMYHKLKSMLIHNDETLIIHNVLIIPKSKNIRG